MWQIRHALLLDGSNNSLWKKHEIVKFTKLRWTDLKPRVYRNCCAQLYPNRVLMVQHEAHPYFPTSVSHFCLRRLASLHHHPQNEPSIIALTNTLTAGTHHWTAATSTWNGNMVRTKLFFFFFTGISPEFYSSSFTPALCVWYYEEQIFQRGNERACKQRKKRDQRVSVEADNGPVSQHRQPTHPAASRSSQKSTGRSHYCPPSSVFTGMLKIVITSVRTEIFNLDVFVEGLWPSCGEGRQSQGETDSGTEEERWNHIWTEMRTGSARSCSINTLQIRMLNFCYTH